MRAHLLLAVLLIYVLACGDEDSVQDAVGQSSKECLSRYEIVSAINVSPTGGSQYKGSGVLEQRVLEEKLIVRAEVLDVELKSVETDSINFELKGSAYAYENYRFTLLNEVALRVLEYLKGEGPDIITAVVESQLAFNSQEEGDCAVSVFLADFSGLFDSQDGIALLDPTSDPTLYHMGMAHENFNGKYYHHSTWLPGKVGKYYNRSTNEWISIDEVRTRASSVLDEYTLSDDEEWQSCVFSKYYDKGRDPWAYQGFPIPFHNLRDHNIIFNGEDVPVSAGTIVWFWPDCDGDRSDITGRLTGEYADLFEITYDSEYEYTVNEWKGNYGGQGHHLSIWYKRNEGESEQWQESTPGHVITVTEDLEDGVYRFTVAFEGGDVVDCGQEKFEPGQYTVIVDEDGPPSPPVPTNAQVRRRPGSEGWTIAWDYHRPGVDYHQVEVYRLNEGEREIDSTLGVLRKVIFATSVSPI